MEHGLKPPPMERDTKGPPRGVAPGGCFEHGIAESIHARQAKSATNGLDLLSTVLEHEERLLAAVPRWRCTVWVRRQENALEHPRHSLYRISKDLTHLSNFMSTCTE